MLFDTTLRRDLARTFGGTLVVILTIVLTMMLIRTLGQAAGGIVAPQDVVLLLGYTALGHLPTMLALSLFIAVVVTLGRMYRDSEMAIWFASGISLNRFVRPVLRTSWPVLLVVALLVLFVWPWGNRQSTDLRERYEQRSDLSRVAPGTFQSSRDGKRVFFVDRESADAVAARNVFILSADGPRESVTSARSGQLETVGNERWLVLERGQRNEIDSEDAAKSLSTFDQYRVLIGERALQRAESQPPRAMRTIDLLRTPDLRNQGELAWRLGLLFGATNMVLLGVGLAATNPRRASNWNLLVALLGFVVYYNLINLSTAWVAGGKLGLGWALLLLHGGALLLALALLWWRDHAQGGAVVADTQGASMKTVRRLLYRDIVGAVGFVTLAFLSLFFFIDFVDELGDVGKNGYGVVHALLSCALELPQHFYELFPISVLIGTIFALARMAQSSEFTILRTGGLGPGRALGLLSLLAAGFALVNFTVGDYAAPWSEREAVALKAQFRGGRELGRNGAWLKDTRRDASGRDLNVSVNVRRTTPQGVLEGVRIFEFDADSREVARVSARSATVGDGQWTLQDAQIVEWPSVARDGIAGAVRVRNEARTQWPSALDAGVVAAAVLPVSTMSTIELWRYSRHLSSQEQASQRHSIQFWKKALYPLACLVMVALALPFAYLSSRGSGVSFKVFGGIMLGISFVLLNNVAGHLGVLRDWTPWIAAAAPGLLYLLLSMAAFAWLVRFR